LDQDKINATKKNKVQLKILTGKEE
jgi:hypothetical protein